MTIKEIINEILDNADKFSYIFQIPLTTARDFHKILTDKMDSDFLLVMNGSMRGSWPEIITPANGKELTNIDSVMTFFLGAGCRVVAYRIGNVESIFYKPDFSSNGQSDFYSLPLVRYQPQTNEETNSKQEKV